MILEEIEAVEKNDVEKREKPLEWKGSGLHRK
jgi:hypothetical protein